MCHSDNNGEPDNPCKNYYYYYYHYTFLFLYKIVTLAGGKIVNCD